MSPEAEESHWQPTIQGRIAYMHWDQKAKPTPLLVIEQSNGRGQRNPAQQKTPFPPQASGTVATRSRKQKSLGP